ncbi:MAG: hypothetical protein Q8R34_01930 [bacterium]|nr:hypothetical protein [bacterium]
MPKVEIILFDSYLQAIKNSVGSNIFKNLYAFVDGQRMDIYKNGGLSCPVFVSSILVLYGLIQGPPRGPHANVMSVVKNMKDSGWRKVRNPRPGAVLVWEAKETKDPAGDVYPTHQHLGFYLGNSMAISNSSRAGHPIEHHWTYGEKNSSPLRKVTAIYWHDKLGK